MAGWASIALAALALVAAAGGAGGPRGDACELAGADRGRTSSLRCVVCHAGGVGPSIAFEMGAGARAMSHPVEVDYAAVAARHPDRYVPASALPRDVPLVDGKVACTSCHDGASGDPKRVAIPARLCESCHRM